MTPEVRKLSGAAEDAYEDFAKDLSPEQRAKFERYDDARGEMFAKESDVFYAAGLRLGIECVDG